MDKRDFRDELAHGKEQAPWEGDAQGGVPSVALSREMTGVVYHLWLSLAL